VSLTKQAMPNHAEALTHERDRPLALQRILGACPRKKPLQDNVLETRRGDFTISHFLETLVLTGDQHFIECLGNP